MGHDHVYKTIELTGSSRKSVEDAIKTAIDKAAESVRHLRWFEVLETRGHDHARDLLAALTAKGYAPR